MRELPVVLFCRSFLLLLKIGKRCHIRDSPPREEGRYGQSSRNVRRVAVDAIDAQRRSARDAFDEAVWSRHPDAGVKLARATATTEPGTPRRARNKSSNIARGMPDVFGCTCGLLVCLLSHISCTRARRCNGIRRSLRPFLRAMLSQNPGKSCRGNADARHGEAIQTAGFRRDDIEA
jgi:hypothetical protein